MSFSGAFCNPSQGCFYPLSRPIINLFISLIQATKNGLHPVMKYNTWVLPWMGRVWLKLKTHGCRIGTMRSIRLIRALLFHLPPDAVPSLISCFSAAHPQHLSATSTLCRHWQWLHAPFSLEGLSVLTLGSPIWKRVGSGSIGNSKVQIQSWVKSRTIFILLEHCLYGAPTVPYHGN